MTSRFTRNLYELLSSMRFAISLLTLLAIASIAGTVVKQNEPYNAYLNEFGPFWFGIFEKLGLYSVYHAGWFIVVLSFLVLSTSLCIVRQAPMMLREMRSFRENARETSLRQFAHRVDFSTQRADAEQLATQALTLEGFRLRHKQREDGLLIAGKAGQWNRIGYLLTHSAIVMICVGGLFDGDLPLQAELWLGTKQLAPANALMSSIQPANRLPESHGSYRGNVYLPEGQRSGTAIINIKDGILLQDLPFDLTLKKFTIDFYSTGMPKRFASDVLITDRASGNTLERTIEVNKPVIVKGVALYQASFDDGGSRLKLEAHSLTPGATETLPLEGIVGETIKLTRRGEPLTLELNTFRPINVENLSVADNAATMGDAIGKHLGSAGKSARSKDLTNVGPSLQFKLRDAAGQAREYHSYMLPVVQEGRPFLVTGMRDNGADNFRYMRIPARDGNVDAWLGLRALLTSPGDRTLLAKRFTRQAMQGDAVSETMRSRLVATAENTLSLFAAGGYDAIDKFIRDKVPAAERERGAEVFIKMLQGLTWEAMQLQRERQKQPPLTQSAEEARYINDALNAIADSFQYGAPFLLTLKDFTEVKASVIQVTRSPGRDVVYLGCALLVAGVFFMLYVRERRVFLLLKPDGQALLAMSANRKSIDTDEHFDRIVRRLTRLLSEPHHGTDSTRT